MSNLRSRRSQMDRTFWPGRPSSADATTRAKVLHVLLLQQLKKAYVAKHSVYLTSSTTQIAHKFSIQFNNTSNEPLTYQVQTNWGWGWGSSHFAVGFELTYQQTARSIGSCR